MTHNNNKTIEDRIILKLTNHSIWKGEYWLDHVSIVPIFINPETNEIDSDEKLNTKFEVWIEAGPPVNVLGGPRTETSHDYYLDCSGNDLKEALIALMELIEIHYGVE